MYARAAAEPEVRTFEADVTAVEGPTLVLDRTWFYPEGGGQPADRGTLAGYEVADVQARDGTVEHTLAVDPDERDVAVGETVEGSIDDAFRTYCMRAHTASHVLYGAGRRLLDDLGYGGFGIGDEKVRVDFTTSTTIDDALLVELERLVNRAVWESRAVSWEEIPTEEAYERDDVAFNTKTEGGVMADADRVRVVTIDDWDVAACGGTHVSNTQALGPVSVLGRSNPGEGLTRVEFAVGPVGIDHNATVHGAALDAATDLGVGVTDLPDAVQSLRDERDRLAADLDALRGDLIENRLGSFEAVEKRETTWRIGTVSGFEANAVGDAAKHVTHDDVVVAVEEATRPFVVVASSTAVHAGEVVDHITSEFGGGGGGGPPFAQGGGLDTDPQEVVAFVRGLDVGAEEAGEN